MIKRKEKKENNKPNIVIKTHTRQLVTAVCVLITVTLLYDTCNIYKISAEQEIENQPVVITIETADPTVPVMQPIQPVVEDQLDAATMIQEKTELLNMERDNTLYYVIDGDSVFYLKNEYQDYLWQELKIYGHPEFYELLIALMYHESRFDETKVSATNDYGLMQIHGGNIAWLRKAINVESLQDPYDNIDCGIYILLSAYEKYGDVETALVCYNQGDAKVPVGKTTSTKYSRGVLEDLKKLQILE